MSLKVMCAIAMCKGLRTFSRMLHKGGTAMPGL